MTYGLRPLILSLSKDHLLASVVATRSSALGGLHTLAVEHGSTGRRRTPDPLAVCHHEEVVHALE
jgi:hypothetical protein